MRNAPGAWRAASAQQASRQALWDAALEWIGRVAEAAASL